MYIRLTIFYFRFGGAEAPRAITGDVQVVEPPEAIKTVLVRWNNVKIDLTKLAKLRWIEKRSLNEISELVGKGRWTVQTSLRTIRNTGITGLNLTKDERKLVQKQIQREKTIYGGQYR